jgi:hypothetical protein
LPTPPWHSSQKWCCACFPIALDTRGHQTMRHQGELWRVLRCKFSASGPGSNVCAEDVDTSVSS